MENFKLVKNPHEHFATFWKQQNEDGLQRLKELQEDLRRAASHVNSEKALSRCATIEVISPLFPVSNEGENCTASGDGGKSSSRTPDVYWLVSGDVVEVALIACKIVEQQLENERLVEQQEGESRAQLYMDQEN